MKISQFRFENFIKMPNHEKSAHTKVTTLCVDFHILYKYDIDAKCCKFLKTYFALFILSNERYYYKKRQFKFDDVIYKSNHENRTH